MRNYHESMSEADWDTVQQQDECQREAREEDEVMTLEEQLKALQGTLEAALALMERAVKEAAALPHNSADRPYIPSMSMEMPRDQVANAVRCVEHKLRPEAAR
jgi:hypothetical protein